MALQQSGPISLNDLATEYDGIMPYKLSAYSEYADKAAGQQILLSDFYGLSANILILLDETYIDFSAAYNNYGGFHNASASPNFYAFTAMKADGSIYSWGDSSYGGSGEPTDSGYTQVYSTNGAFAALKADGSITAWGDSSYGGSGAPTDSGYSFK